MTLSVVLMALMLGAVAGVPGPATGTLAGLPGSKHSQKLQAIVDDAVRAAIAEFSAPALDTSQVAVTLVDVSKPACEWASTRGQAPVYPASVVKLFYLVAAHDALESQRLKDSEEFQRALRDMIVDSSNDATSYVLDLLTGTTSGPELDSLALAAWADQRNAVNWLFAVRGYPGINCNKKPWGDGPYGRETQASKAFTPGRNLLTTDATARLLSEIVTARASTQARCQQMLDLLARDPQRPSDDPDDQGRGFSGGALSADMKLWSKAGWTSRVRHDAACIQLKDGRRFVLVTFTEGHGDERGIVPEIARSVVRALVQP